MTRANPIILAVWVVIVAITAYLIIGVIQSRQSTEARARDQALSYARLVEQHASAAFDRANNALVDLTEHLRADDLAGTAPLPDARRGELEEFMRGHQQRAAGIISMFLARADGRVAANSLHAPPGTDVTDRTYFRSLAQGRVASPVVSELVYARISKKWGVMVARRIDMPDGSFGGMIGANLGLTANFSDFYSTLSLGKNSTVSLRDPQNRLLVRHPIAEDKLGKQLASGGPINERLGAGDKEGVLVAPSPIDRAERIFGFRKLANYPIYAVVGLSLEDALSVWRRDRDDVAVATLLVILAGLFITDALRRKQRADDELRDLNQSLEARVVERTQQLLATNELLKAEIAERKLAQASISSYADRLQQMTYRMVAVQEEEQRRLARELHDQVSSNLAAVCIDIDLLKEQLPAGAVPGAAQQLTECAALLRTIVASVRDVCADLHPAILDYAGLIPALEHVGKKIEKRTGIRVSVSGLDDEIRLPADREVALFRIAQEALMNCVKHSGAKSVAIELANASSPVTLSIKDDGLGFDPVELGLDGRAPGLGLLSMQERAQAIGATCRVESARGRGTQVIVELAR